MMQNSVQSNISVPLLKQLHDEIKKGRRRDNDVITNKYDLDKISALLDDSNLGDINARGESGMPALHLAALYGLEDVAFEVIVAGADVHALDSRGWTALDVAGAKAKAAVERVLISAGADSDLVAKDVRISTVGILKLATKAETATLKLQVDEMYEELYLIPELRPVMDAVALDARGNRANMAFRCYVANDPFTKAIAPGEGVGACDPRVHTLAIGGRRDLLDDGKVAIYERCFRFTAKDLVRGTLMHELTHAASYIVYRYYVLPYPPNDKKRRDAYTKAIVATIARSHLVFGSADALIQELFTARMINYCKVVGAILPGVESVPTEVRGTPLTMIEYIVSPAQSIVLFGVLETRKHAPELLDYFLDVFSKDCASFVTRHGGSLLSNTSVPKGLPVKFAKGGRATPAVLAELMGLAPPACQMSKEELMAGGVVSRMALEGVRARLATPPPGSPATVEDLKNWKFATTKLRVDFLALERTLPCYIDRKWMRSKSFAKLPSKIDADDARELVTFLVRLCIRDGAIIVPDEDAVRGAIDNWACLMTRWPFR